MNAYLKMLRAKYKSLPASEAKAIESVDYNGLVRLLGAQEAARIAQTRPGMVKRRTTDGRLVTITYTNGKWHVTDVKSLPAAKTKALKEKKCPFCDKPWGTAAVQWAVDEGECIYCENPLDLNEFEKSLPGAGAKAFAGWSIEGNLGVGKHGNAVLLNKGDQWRAGLWDGRSEKLTNEVVGDEQKATAHYRKLCAL